MSQRKIEIDTGVKHVRPAKCAQCAYVKENVNDKFNSSAKWKQQSKRSLY